MAGGDIGESSKEIESHWQILKIMMRTMSIQMAHPKARSGKWLLHYTDADGYKAIASQQVWTFKAQQPKGGRPYGVYFTRLLPDDNKLPAGTMLPKAKREYVLVFVDEAGLEPVPGGKGDYNLFTNGDYLIDTDRQRYKGLAKDLP